MRTFPGLRRDALKVAAVACALGLAGPVWAAKHVIKVSHAVTVNHPALTMRMAPSLEKVVGADNVVEMDLTMGAEDFSYYANEVPGFFYFVGATPPDQDPLKAPSNHSPEFFLDEQALKVGTRTMLQVALDYLHEVN